MFYEGAEASLSIKAVRRVQIEQIQRDVGSLLQQIQTAAADRPPAGTEVVWTLVMSFQELAAAYYNRIEAASEQVSAVEQNRYLFKAIEKIAWEWAHILPIVQAVIFGPTINRQTENAFNLLGLILKGAYAALDLPAESRIALVPHVGRHFELVSFKYAPGIRLIGIPLYALNTPWEWSVIWHELAGLLIDIRKPKSGDDVAPEQWQPDDLFPQFFRVPVSDFDWPEGVADKPRSSDREKSIAAKGWDKFWLHWEKVFEGNTKRRKELGQNWRRDWIVELIEDSCSVLVFGPLAYRILTDVFLRRYDNLQKPLDLRHPPPVLRLEVAYQLLRLMKAAATGQPVQIVHEVENSFDPILNDHNRLPGAAEMAAWVWSNRDQLVKEVYAWDDENSAQSKQDAFSRLATSIRNLFELHQQQHNARRLDKLARQIILDANNLAGQISLTFSDRQAQAQWWNRLWAEIGVEMSDGALSRMPASRSASSQAGAYVATLEELDVQALSNLTFSYNDPADVQVAQCWELSAEWWSRCWSG